MSEDESNPYIPENVIEALAKARKIGRYNMLDRTNVVDMIEHEIDSDAAAWLWENDDLYMKALLRMGDRVRRDRNGS